MTTALEPALIKVVTRLAPRAPRRLAFGLKQTPAHQRRTWSNTRACAAEKPSDDGPYTTTSKSDSSYSQAAANLSQNVSSEETNHFQQIEEASRERQRVSPWTHQGSDVPPVARNRSASAMVKGKLLTTPSRMLKFIIPLSPNDRNSDRKDMEPLALLVHPQQPLSYLERLIQSELPVLDDGKPPQIVFRAEDTENEPGREPDEEQGLEQDENSLDDAELSQEDKTQIDGKMMRTGKLNDSAKSRDPAGPQDAVTSDDPEHENFVRWSPSTEIGDFIRDAARGKEFALDIESAGTIYIGVPSFEDRTYYLRMRLRKTAQRILQMADLKRDCDKLAHRGAQRVAQMGFGGLITWWAAVYYLTFRTELGWDVMEPVTYLVGLSSLIGGYMWFLYHNREVSYRSAMNFTISRRQGQLYEQKGLDIHKWESLVEEGNRLRREIKMVADEYDVEWDEKKDEGHQKVAQALREERKKEKRKQDKDDDDDDSEDKDDEEEGKSGKSKEGGDDRK